MYRLAYKNRLEAKPEPSKTIQRVYNKGEQATNLFSFFLFNIHLSVSILGIGDFLFHRFHPLEYYTHHYP